MKRWEDPAFVQQQARERYNMVMPGERKYLVLDDEQEDRLAESEPGVAPLDEDVEMGWADRLWGSVLSSGQESRKHVTNQKQPTAQDLDTLSRQLGRPVRDVAEIGARCVCGNPLVATTAPRLSNGIPFPTTFYLSHPHATAAASRLENAGVMDD